MINALREFLRKEMYFTNHPSSAQAAPPMTFVLLPVPFPSPQHDRPHATKRIHRVPRPLANCAACLSFTYDSDPEELWYIISTLHRPRLGDCMRSMTATRGSHSEKGLIPFLLFYPTKTVREHRPIASYAGNKGYCCHRKGRLAQAQRWSLLSRRRRSAGVR